MSSKLLMARIHSGFVISRLKNENLLSLSRVKFKSVLELGSQLIKTFSWCHPEYNHNPTSGHRPTKPHWPVQNLHFKIIFFFSVLIALFSLIFSWKIPTRWRRHSCTAEQFIIALAVRRLPPARPGIKNPRRLGTSVWRRSASGSAILPARTPPERFPRPKASGSAYFRSVVSNFRTRRMAGALLRFRTRSSVGAHGSRAQPPAALARVVSSRPHLGCCQDGSMVAPRPRNRKFMKRNGTGH